MQHRSIKKNLIGLFLSLTMAVGIFIMPAHAESVDPADTLADKEMTAIVEAEQNGGWLQLALRSQRMKRS